MTDTRRLREAWTRPDDKRHPFERGGLLSTTCARPDCLQAPEARVHRAALDRLDSHEKADGPPR